MTRRTERVGELIRAELSEVLQRAVKDPRLQRFVTITEVSVAPDLKHAKVYVSVLGGEEEKQEVFRGLLAASGYLRRELISRLKHLRNVPELDFVLDTSIEHGSKVLELLREVQLETGGGQNKE